MKTAFLTIYYSIFHAAQHFSAWALTLIFSCMLGIMYARVKQMQQKNTANW